eukprot:Gb_22413 [translate_table: standard]
MLFLVVLLSRTIKTQSASSSVEITSLLDGPAKVGSALAAVLVNCMSSYTGLFVLVMLLWSYFAVVLTDPGGVPPNWRPMTDEESGDTVPLTCPDFGGPGLVLQPQTALNDPLNSRIRYCRKCSQLKPPRCHHCSVFVRYIDHTSVGFYSVMKSP